MKKIILTLAIATMAAMLSSCTCCQKTEEAPAGEATTCECCEGGCESKACECCEGGCESKACEECGDCSCCQKTE